MQDDEQPTELDIDAEAPPEPTPFERQLAATLQDAISRMIKDGLIEVEESHVEALVVEMTEAGKDAHSPKHMLKKLVKVLVHSERIDELYGTDEMLMDALKAMIQR